MSFMRRLKKRITTLRSYITITVSAIVVLCLVCVSITFYIKTSTVLTHNYKQLIRQRLSQINAQIDDQIRMIDSINTLFSSNSLIRESLDPKSSYSDTPYLEKKLSLEKQMGYLLYNTYGWNAKLIDSVYIFDSQGNAYRTVSPAAPERSLAVNAKVARSMPRNLPSLVIRTLDNDKNFIYFIRNIYSIYTGEYNATVVIDINQNTWVDYYSSNLDPNWFVYLYSDQMSVITQREMAVPAAILSAPDSARDGGESPREMAVNGTPFFVAAQKIENADITSVVAAPKHQLFQDLNETMKTFSLFVCIVVAAALSASILLSRAVVRPIEKMIEHVKNISRGKREKMPELLMYTEFNEYSIAFNHMLEQLNIYYRDNFQKQLLLKNAEIQALQSQMDPHFLFNVLNTIAWKAQMCDNEEIYQMVISLGEMLKRNTMSKENAFITLEEELEYVRFYVYLQKMRFEDKISVELKADRDLCPFKIPCFCIQPLVENAIVHGLEPKRGPGALTVAATRQGELMEISIIDDGIGFEAPGDLQAEAKVPSGGHTHIALKNLDKRLFLLFGETARLRIASAPGQGTAVTFCIPLCIASVSENQEEL